MMNAFMGAITLLPVYKGASKPLWWIFFGYCVVIFIMGVLVTGLSLGKNIGDESKRIIDRFKRNIFHFE